MEAVNSKKYSEYISFAKACKCGKVYPISIAEGYQTGEIFADSASNPKAVLFWHYCGFAHISGEYNEGFLEEIYEMLIDKDRTQNRRFILFTDDKNIGAYFRSKDKLEISERYFFEHGSGKPDKADMPEGFELKEIDSGLLTKISGRITPAFSWSDMDEFLSKGKGYCVTADGEAAAWAFSAAISDSEIDIGIETAEKYQRKGLAVIAAKAMIDYAISVGKAPVWACHSQNTGSIKVAEKTGFKKTAECAVIKGI